MDSAEGPSWAEFTRNLAVVLDGLPPGAKLVLPASGNRYVQFAMDTDQLYADLPCNKYLADQWRMSEEDHATLVADGWSRASADENWARDIDYPVFEDCTQLAEKATAALRTVLRITGPLELNPDGWVDGRGVNNSSLDVTGLGLGPGRIGESNAKSAVHWYIRDRGLGESAAGIEASRIDEGWVLFFPRGTTQSSSGQPKARALEFYVADDHFIEHRPPDTPASEFRAAFGRRYRERNGLNS